jgi:hypothetical protein
MSTHEAVGHLCRALRISERDVGYAGIKDARAVATSGCRSWPASRSGSTRSTIRG